MRELYGIVLVSHCFNVSCVNGDDKSCSKIVLQMAHKSMIAQEKRHENMNMINDIQ